MNCNISTSKILIAFFLILGLKSFGGVNTYVCNQSSSIYTPITGGTTYGNYLSLQDAFSNIPIGFNFNYNGIVFNNFGVANDGYIKMGATAPGDIYNNSYMLESGTLANVIAAFNIDLIMGFITKGNYTAGLNEISNVTNMSGIAVGDIIDPDGIYFTQGTTVVSKDIANNKIYVSDVSNATVNNEDVVLDNGEIRVQTIGTAPNRVCVIQWKHAHNYYEIENDYNFQIRLSEGTNKVSFVYGSFTYLTAANEVQVGLTGNTRTDFEIRKTATDWNATTAGIFNNSTCSTANTIIPANGLTFEFTNCLAPTAPVVVSAVNPACSGSQVSLSITGGSLNSALQWTWRTGSCVGPIVNQGSTYTYTSSGTNMTFYVVGSGGCINGPSPCTPFTQNALVSPSVSLTSIPTITDVCEGTNVILNAAGAPTISWSNGIQNNISFAPTVNNIYTVTGTAANGCTNAMTRAVTVTNLSGLVVGVSPSNGTICEGQFVTLTASGLGTYSWSGGVTNGQAFSPTTSGTYTVTATSANGLCTTTATVSVVVNTNPTVTIASTPSSASICSNQLLTLSGGGASTYVWSGGVANNVGFFPINNTIYTVTGTSTNGCTNVATKSISVLPAPTVSATSSPTSAAVCFGGSITLIGTGASNYAWSNNATNGIATIATASNVYTVTGSVANGCSATSTISITVNPLPTITINSTPVNAIVCPGASAVLTASGANTYVWTGGITNGVPFTLPISTTYTVTATSVDGCTKVASKLVNVTTNPTVTINSVPINSAICIGANASLTASGISNISWSGGITNGVSFAPTTTATYTVTGNNAAGCIGSGTKIITVNLIPSIGIISTPSNGTLCAGNSATLAGTGGATYSWSGGITNNIAFVPTSTNTYTVTGASAAGCSKTSVIAITVNPLPTIGASSTAINNTVCAGGIVVLNGSGGNSYTWSNGVLDNTSFIPTSTATYTVTGANQFNCSATSTITLNVNPLPIISITTTPSNTTICEGTAISFNASAANCTLNWSNGVTNSTSFIPTASNVYTVTATNTTTGCISTATIAIVVNAAPTLTVITNPTNASVCNGESIILSANGPLNIAWSGGITNANAFTPTANSVYTVTGSTAQGCTITSIVNVVVNDAASISVASTPSNTSICNGQSVLLNATGNATYTWSGGISNNSAFLPTATTNYTVTGITANGCSISTSILVSVNAYPTISIASIPASNSVCAGSAINLTASGGSAIVWSGSVSNGVSFIPTATATYTVTSNGNSGCNSSSTITVVVNAIPTVTATSLPLNPVYCAGGSLTLIGVGASTYTWSGGAINGVPFFPTNQGIYTVTGTNAAGCSNTATRTIYLASPISFTSIAYPNGGVVCAGKPVSLVGGSAYAYTWNNGIVNGQSFVPAASAIYTVTATDNFGCTKTGTLGVTVNPLPVITASTVPSPANVCLGNAMSISGSGGINYTIDNGVTDNSPFTPTANTTYIVTGTDANGCSATTSVAATVLPLPTIAIATSPNNNSFCNGQSISMTASGASTYVWSNGLANGASFNVSSDAIYTVTATSADGCVNTATKSISLSTISANIASNPAVPSLCPNQNITLTGTGGVTNTWSGGVTNGVSFIPSASGSYTLTSTDANGCSATSSINITINNGATLNLSTIPANGQVCAGGNAQIVATSNVAITISNGVTNSTNFIPSAGTVYSVTATNGAGCSIVSTVQFSVAATLTVTATAVPANGQVCSGANITLNGNGASTYTWSGNAINGQGFPLSANNIYTVTGVNASGCSATSTISVSTLSIPTVTVAALPTTSPICTGTPLTLTASGNASTYTWNNNVVNGVSFASVSGVSYIVTATGSNGCTNTASSPIVVSAMPAPMNINTQPSNKIFCRNSKFSVFNNIPSQNLTIAGLYNPAITTSLYAINLFYPQAATTYTVTSTNGACSISTTFGVVVKPLPIVTVTTNLVNSNICAGQPVTFSGNCPPTYNCTYVYSGGVVDGTPFTPTTSNIYTVTATAISLCSSSAVVSLNIVPYPTVGLTSSPSAFPICENVPVTLTATGNAQTYAWSGGISNAVPFLTNTSTIYTVTGTNASLCSVTATRLVGITNLPAPTITASPGYTVCAGTQVTLNATQSGVTCNWSNGVVNNVPFTPNASTIYTCTSATANGCVSTTTVQFTINNLPTVSIASTATNNAICEGGSAVLTASGANTYVWQNNSAVTNAISVSPAATSVYTVVGTNAVGCTISKTYSLTVNLLNNFNTTINSNPLLSPCVGATYTVNFYPTNGGYQSFSVNPPVANNVSILPTTTTVYTLTAVSTAGCTNSTTVLLEVWPLPVWTFPASVTRCVGAVSNIAFVSNIYSFYFDYSGGNINNPTTTITQPGTSVYTVTCMDFVTSCSITSVINLIGINPPVIALSNTPSNNIVCPGQPITLNQTAGTATTWSGGVQNNVSFVPTVSSVYTVTATNAGICTRTSSVSVTVSAPINITLNPVPLNGTVCSGNPATINAIANGATLSVAGLGSPTLGTPFLPSASATYTITSTNANGCTKTATQPIVVNTSPTIAVTSSANTNQICVGSTVTLTASGSNSYVWLGGLGITSSITVTPTATTVYTIVGSNANGCTVSTTYTVNVLNYPTISVATLPANGSVCPGLPFTITGTSSNANITISGNVLNGISFVPTANTVYTLVATNAAGCSVSTTQSVTMLPAQGAITLNNIPALGTCIGNTFTITATGAQTYTWANLTATTSSISGLVLIGGPKLYTVTGANSSGCTRTSSIWMFGLVLPNLSYTSTPASGTVCLGQQIKLNYSTGGYGSWSAPIVNGVYFTPTATTVYTLTATSASNGCTKTMLATVTVSTPNPITFANSPTNNAVCEGQSLIINASSVGSTISLAGAGTPANNVGFVPSSSGIYTVTASNSLSCTSTTTLAVTINPLPIISVSNSPTTGICPGSTASLTASGAANFVWNNNTTTALNVINPTITTTYTAVGTDANGCSNSASATMQVFDIPTISISTIPANASICPNNNVTINANVGVGNTATISGGVTLGTAFNLSTTTTYTITATNAIGCSTTSSITIFVNPSPVLTISSSPVAASYCQGRTLTLTTTGANAYTWSGGITENTPFVVSTSQIYTVTGVNASGCSATATQSITVLPKPTITTVTNSATNLICYGSTVLINATGASTYTFSPSVGNNTLFYPAITNTYTVTGTGANGCTASATRLITVSRPNPITFSRTPSTANVCAGTSVTWNSASVGSTMSITGPFGVALGVPYYPQATSYYTITATNALGCTRSGLVYFPVLPVPVLTITPIPNPATVCAGQTVNLTASGAVNYTWSGGISNGAFFIPSASANYTVVGRGSNLCTAVVVVPVTVNPIPTINVVASATSITNGQSVNLCASGPSTIYWSSGVVNCVTFIPSATAVYTVTGISAVGCVTTSVITVAVTIEPNGDKASKNTEIENLNSSIVDGQTMLNWDIEAIHQLENITVFRGSSENLLSPIASMPQQLDDHYTFIDKDGLNTASYYQIKATKNNKEVVSKVIYVDAQSKISLYPNPVVGESFHVNVNIYENTPATIKIINTEGKVMRIIQTELSKGENSISVDASNLNSGHYILQVISKNNEIGLVQFVKQ
jgi:Secretion system C-terminal sorting domain